MKVPLPDKPVQPVAVQMICLDFQPCTCFARELHRKALTASTSYHYNSITVPQCTLVQCLVCIQVHDMQCATNKTPNVSPLCTCAESSAVLNVLQCIMWIWQIRVFCAVHNFLNRSNKLYKSILRHEERAVRHNFSQSFNTLLRQLTARLISCKRSAHR